MKPTSDSMFPLPGESPEKHFRRLASSPRPLVSEMANRLYGIPETHVQRSSSDASFPGGIQVSLLLPAKDFYKMASDNGWHLTYFNGWQTPLSIRATTKRNQIWATNVAICYAFFKEVCPRTGVGIYEVVLYSRPSLRDKDAIL